jgi:hypothetical protein
MGGGTFFLSCPHPGSFHRVKFADPPHRFAGEGIIFSIASETLALDLIVA